MSDEWILDWCMRKKIADRFLILCHICRRLFSVSKLFTDALICDNMKRMCDELNEGQFFFHFCFSLFLQSENLVCSMENRENKELTVILAIISYFFPFFVINLQHNSSTDADIIWKTGWLLVNVFFNVFISSFRVNRHAILTDFFTKFYEKSQNIIFL